MWKVKHNKNHQIRLPESWGKSIEEGFVPQNYFLSKELKRAVELAIQLNKPLLVTGEPGTGKTLLAKRITYDLHKLDPEFLPEPLVFTCHTTSVADDLFYTYDALSHFYDAHHNDSGQKPDIMNYIKPAALGEAIALTNPSEVKNGRFLGRCRLKDGARKHNHCRHSVVLIDEIDKTPRDFPNDLLYRIEEQEFEIKENRYVVRRPSNAKHRIVTIITSNTEKMLPKPFLRRCLFFHIPFPSEEELLEIVKRQSSLSERNLPSFEAIIQHFHTIRKAILKKRPGTAELIDWLKVLEIYGLIDMLGQKKVTLTEESRELLRMSYATLAKTKEDLKTIESIIESGLSK